MHVKLLHRSGAAFSRMSPKAKIVVAVALAMAIAATTALVYATGGIRFSYSHLMYVPIVLAGIAFGVPGGLLAALVGGIALGPLMPLSTETGEMQEPVNWAYRMLFFAFIGALVGTWSQLLRRHIQELEWLSDHDRDTGLLNVAGLLKRLDRRVQDKSAFTLAVVQLNGFLEVQNTYGPGFGTRLLTEVIARIETIAPEGTVLAVLQPDRLAAVVTADRTGPLTRQRIEDAMAHSFVVDGVPLHVDASIGVASYPTHASAPEELLQRASIAMHWATRSKNLISVYDMHNDQTSRDNLALLGAIPVALQRAEFEVWHQLQLHLPTDQIAGTEALLRWNHPSRGLVQPGSFIPQLEETTLINPVTHLVIDAACAAAAAWCAQGHRLRVSINLSVRNLTDRSLLQILEQCRDKHRLPPELIELEITESAIMADPEQCRRLIETLRAHGYGVAVDDFGVGQSSLTYLQKLPISTLKIDQEFVKTLSTDTKNQTIVRSVLQLATSLGLETVAEGVEDAPSLALLRDWGCTYAQGYYVHKPAPFADVSRSLAQRTTSAPASRPPLLHAGPATTPGRA